MLAIVSDLRFALRQLRRSPGFTAAALSCLTLGVGATTAIFSVVNAVVLRPLPYADPGRLLRVYSEFPTFPNGGLRKFWISPPEFRDLRADNRVFETLDAWQMGGANLAGAGADPVRVVSAQLSGTMMQSLGVAPLMGRVIEAEDDKEGAPFTAVLSYGLWQGMFGGDASVLGKEILYNGSKCTVIGVMPRGYQFPPGQTQPPEIWTPLQLTAQNMTQWGSHRLYLLGRLKTGYSFEQARQELVRLMSEYGKLSGPKTHRFNPQFHTLLAFPLLDETVGSVRPAMLVLLAATALVLLIACGNVANLLLARAQAREREIAVRRAMGASSAGLIRQFFLEGVLLSSCGAVLGVGLAWAALKLILAYGSASIPRAAEVGLNGDVLLFAVACALATGILFGLAPLVQLVRGKLNEVLKAGGGRTTATREAHWLRQGLVVSELALALVLLIGSSLLLQAFWKLTRVNAGIRTDGVMTMRVVLPSAVYRDAATVQRFWASLRQNMSAIPGVQGSALVSGLPPQRPINANDTYIEGLVPKPGGPIHNVDYWNAVSPGYFQLLGMKLKDGRYLEERDGTGAPGVLVVNEAFARTFYPGQSAIGRRVKPGGGPEDSDPWFTIVGVVEDAKNQGLDKAAGAELYFSIPQTDNNFRSASLVVKGTGDPWQWVKPTREAVRQIDATIPIAQVQPLDEVISAARARPRFLALLLGLFAAVALGLAALGIFSVMSYAVAQRTNEFGIRMALGAGTGDVLGLVLRQGAVLLAAGVALGGGGALMLNRALRGALPGIGEFQAAAWVAMAVLLASVTLAACYAPARRATKVDPMVALRYE